MQFQPPELYVTLMLKNNAQARLIHSSDDYTVNVAEGSKPGQGPCLA